MIILFIMVNNYSSKKLFLLLLISFCMRTKQMCEHKFVLTSLVVDILVLS